MNADFDRFLADANEEFDRQPTKAAGEYARRKFTCESCDGTGLWSGGINRQGNNKCHACNGLGYFVTSKADRLKAQEQRMGRKAQKIAAAQAANATAVGGNARIAALSKASGWSEFAASLMEQHGKGREWSDKQIASINSMLDKLEANAKAKAEAREANAVEVDLFAIEQMFYAAILSGYKKPMYRANGLRIKPGKGDALYVLNEDRIEYGHFGEQPAYEGKITDGKFYGIRDTTPDTPAKLQAIAADPRGEAVRHGQRTGRCSCCGRELTKHTSIEAGIGPICAQKWGL